MLKAIKSFIKDESGLETAEYAVMLGLIVVAIVIAVSTLRTSIGNKMTDTATTIDGAK